MLLLSPITTGRSRSATQAQPMLALLPRYLRQLETGLLLFCGLYGLLVSQAVTHSSQLQILCLGFIGLGLVRWYVPAGTALQWLMGAFAALGLALVIYLHPASGGVSGPYLFLLLLMAMAYPMAMGEFSALFYGLVMVVVYLAGVWLKPAALSRELVLARTVLISGICFLSAWFGLSLRRSHWLFEALLRDGRSGAYNEQGLSFYGQRMVERSQAAHQNIALALLRMPHGWMPGEISSQWDLLITNTPKGASREEVLAEGEQSANSLSLALRDMQRQLSAVVGNEGLVARMANGDWVLLVPGMARKRLLEILIHRFGHPLQVPFGNRNDELFVPITPCVLQVDDDTPNLQDTMSRAYSLWQRSERAGTVSLD
jgi:hypothetical protein